MRKSQVTENKALVFSLHFKGFQNGPFYTSKRPFLSLKMNRFGEQNGPFCDVKWLVLKKAMAFLPILFSLFTESEAFALLKRQKNFAVFFGIFC